MPADSREPALWVYVLYLVVLALVYERGYGEQFVLATVLALLTAEVARWWRGRR